MLCKDPSRRWRYNWGVLWQRDQRIIVDLDRIGLEVLENDC